MENSRGFNQGVLVSDPSGNESRRVPKKEEVTHRKSSKKATASLQIPIIF